MKTIKIGSSSPWGRIDGIDHLFGGILFCSTPSHGGYYVPDKLARKRMPDEIKGSLWAPQDKDFWIFEEDSDAAIVALYFPEILSNPERVPQVYDAIMGMIAAEYWDEKTRIILGKEVLRRVYNLQNNTFHTSLN